MTTCHSSFKKIFAIKSANIKRLKTINNDIDNKSGIYILKRLDAQDFKYAYIGQAKHLDDRLASHLTGYSHIDLSIKKHGFKNENNPYGYEIEIVHCDVDELDDLERFHIKQYANQGYQLRNNTIGGQDNKKKQLGDSIKKGYQQGIEQGKKKAYKAIKVYFDKYIEPCIKGTPNKIKQRKLIEFLQMLNNID